jgi:ribose 5-phosphate isomerase B
MNIIIGSDHAGFELKEKIKIFFKNNYNFTDVGCYNDTRCDYPDIAKLLCKKITDSNFGILVCGTGIGMTICANRFPHIRCALCHNSTTAEMARKHNNANVLSLGARILDEESVYSIIKVFLENTFEGGRHQNRINKFL